MKSDPTFDRRKYLRVLTEQLVSIGRLDVREGLAHALDLSMGGIRFQCVGLQAEVGEMLKVTMTLGDSTLTPVGQITRVERLDEFTQEVALAFVKMEDSWQALLDEHLPPPTEREDERRAYSRVLLESIVSVGRANLIDVVAQARDLSMGGVRFMVEGLDMALGDMLRVTIGLDGRTVIAIGQVVRLTEVDESRQEVAMAFLEVDAHSLDWMRRHLSAEDADDLP